MDFHFNLNMPELDSKSFARIQALVYDYLGINLKDTKQLMVRNRLIRKIKALRFKDFNEYLDFIENPQNESHFQEFVNAITTNKTDFFREHKQFEILRDEILPELEEHQRQANGQRYLRVWSAACSTGEEPYTIAMVLKDYFEEKKDWKYKILATDINSQVLEQSQLGVYPVSALEPIPQEQLRKYFLKGVGNQEGFFQVKPELKEVVVFKQLNLFTPEYPFRKGVDIIFCRNTAIYFDKIKKIELFHQFYQWLKPGGYMFIGHSESLNNIHQEFKFYKNNIYKK